MSTVQLTREQFLYQEKASRDTIDFKRAYVDVAGDLLSGLMLSQIIYYYLPTAGQNRDKLRVFHAGEYWLAKKRDDWWNECRLTPAQVDRCLGVLEERKVIITDLFRFNGSPTKHLRLNWEVFLQLYAEAIQTEGVQNGFSTLSKFEEVEKQISHKVENGIDEKREMDIAETPKTLTESTAEIPSKITQESTVQNAASEIPEWEKALSLLRMEFHLPTRDDNLDRRFAALWEEVPIYEMHRKSIYGLLSQKKRRFDFADYETTVRRISQRYQAGMVIGASP